MSEEWGDWIDHDGKGCPCVGQMVWVILGEHDGDDPKLDDGDWSEDWRKISNDEGIGIAGDDGAWNGGDDDYYPIIRYRIRKSPGMAILLAILADLPAPVKTDGVIA